MVRLNPLSARVAPVNPTRFTVARDGDRMFISRLVA